jgi:S-layer protein
VITGDAQSDTVNMADGTIATNILHVELSKAGAISGASLTASQAGSISITANDTSTDAQPGAHVDSLALTADHATSLAISGNAALQLTASASTNLATIDASAMTGSLSFTTLAGATQHVIGGAGADTLQSKGNLDVLTGGAGNDMFIVNAVANPNSYATITDASAGDIVAVADSAAGMATIRLAPITLADTAVFQDYANAAVDAGGNASGHAALAWFVYGGDTYLVASEHDATTAPGFASGTDLIVKLAGLHDLGTVSINATPGQPVLVQLNT